VYFDEKEFFKDFENLPGGQNTFLSILKLQKEAVGAFGELLELQKLNTTKVLNFVTL